MLRSMCSVLVGLALVAFVPGLASGEQSGWKMPNLNPFSGSGSGSKRSKAPTSGWKVPSLWQPTKSPAKSRVAKQQPSTWNRMTNGTQQFFSKTADTLTPWDNKKPSSAPTITGSNSIFTHNKPKEKESSGVAPASWWGSEKSEAPKTVNDFLSQPRPR